MSIKYWETRAEIEARREVQKDIPAPEIPTVEPSVFSEQSGTTEHTDVAEHTEIAEQTDISGQTEFSEQTDFSKQTDITESTEADEKINITVMPVQDEQSDSSQAAEVVDVSETTEVADTSAATEIVDISEVRKEHEDKARIDREVDEFFAEEEKKEIELKAAEYEAKQKASSGRILKYIFVDGLLGIPFLAVFCVLVSVLVVLFSLISTVLFVGSLVCVAGAVLLIINSFSTVGIHPQTGFFTFGASLAAIGIGLLMFVLAILVSSKIVPFIASLVDRLARKLSLFRN